MKTLLAIAALILLAANLFLGYVGTDILEERNAARAERDSIAVLLTKATQQADSALAVADGLVRYIDSVNTQTPTPVIVRERALELMRFAPLQQAVDSLEAE